jgi:nucleotide-binding universal stress UspA family protein
MYQRIVVAIDGSDTARRGLDEAIRLARRDGARLLLLHVTEAPLPLMLNGDWTLPAIPVETYAEAGRKLLDAALAEARAAGVEAEALQADADGRRVGPLISERARAWRADLLVVGTHGRRGLDRLLLGSVADGVIRTAALPVLLVPAAETTPAA